MCPLDSYLERTPRVLKRHYFRPSNYVLAQPIIDVQAGWSRLDCSFYHAPLGPHHNQHPDACKGTDSNDVFTNTQASWIKHCTNVLHRNTYSDNVDIDPGEKLLASWNVEVQFGRSAIILVWHFGENLESIVCLAWGSLRPGCVDGFGLRLFVFAAYLFFLQANHLLPVGFEFLHLFTLRLAISKPAGRDSSHINRSTMCPLDDHLKRTR
jgi:hypothetical protein